MGPANDMLYCSIHQLCERKTPSNPFTAYSSMVKSMKEGNIQARQGQQTWIYNALCNVSSLEHIFHLTFTFRPSKKMGEMAIRTTVGGT
jgi:hypothetical protein